MGSIMNDLPWAKGRVCHEFKKIQKNRKEIFKLEKGELTYLKRIAEHVSDCKECFKPIKKEKVLMLENESDAPVLTVMREMLNSGSSSEETEKFFLRCRPGLSESAIDLAHRMLKRAKSGH